jgi:hypothetical protein
MFIVSIRVTTLKKNFHVTNEEVSKNKFYVPKILLFMRRLNPIDFDFTSFLLCTFIDYFYLYFMRGKRC